MRASFQPTFSFVISRFPPPHVFVLTPLHSRAPAQRATSRCVRSAERPGRHKAGGVDLESCPKSSQSRSRCACALTTTARRTPAPSASYGRVCGVAQVAPERGHGSSMWRAWRARAGLRGTRQPESRLWHATARPHHSGACRHHTTKTPPAACGLARQQYGPHVSRLPSGRSPRTPRLSRTDEGRGDHPHQPRDAGGEGLRLRLQLLVTRRIQPA